MVWEDTSDYIRSGHSDPDKYSTFRTTTFDDKLPKGIKLIYAQRKDGKGWETQNYLFSKLENWTIKKAKKWFSSNNKEINKQLVDFLIRDLIKSGELPALIVPNPYGRMIRDKVVKFIVKTKEYTKYSGKPVAIAQNDGKVYAIVNINSPIKLSKKQFDFTVSKHSIGENELIEWAKIDKNWMGNNFWGYSFKLIKEFKVPIDFFIPPDTRDWVEGINILNMRLEDINKYVLEKVSNGEMYDLHNKIHNIWKLLEQKDVTEQNIKMTDLIIEKHVLLQEFFKEKDLEHKNIDSLDKIKNDKEDKIEKIIRQEGDKWVLYSSDGKKVLGRHDTKEQALAQERAIEVNKSNEFSKYIPICKIDNEKQIVYGEVLVPDVIDAQGHKISAEEIEKSCHNYMEDSQKHKIMHKGEHIHSTVVENYIVPQDLEFINPQGNKVSVSKGTWIMATKIYDKEIWKDVKSGKFSGYSIGGFGMLTPTEE